MSLLRGKNGNNQFFNMKKGTSRGGKVAFPQNQQGCGKEGGNG